MPSTQHALNERYLLYETAAGMEYQCEATLGSRGNNKERASQTRGQW